MSAKQPSLPFGTVCTRWVASVLLATFLIVLLGCMRRYVILDCVLATMVLVFVALQPLSMRFVRAMPPLHRLVLGFLVAMIMFGHGAMPISLRAVDNVQRVPGRQYDCSF